MTVPPARFICQFVCRAVLCACLRWLPQPQLLSYKHHTNFTGANPSSLLNSFPGIHPQQARNCLWLRKSTILCPYACGGPTLPPAAFFCLPLERLALRLSNLLRGTQLRWLVSIAVPNIHLGPWSSQSDCEVQKLRLSGCGNCFPGKEIVFSFLFVPT